MDILDDIDRAISDCAVSGDAMRWMPEPPRRHIRVASPPPREMTAEERAAVIAAFREVARRLADAMAPVLRAAGEVARQLHAAQVIPPALPADPRLRALEFRRNRNTGPPVPPRAPRRIDPKRVR